MTESIPGTVSIATGFTYLQDSPLANGRHGELSLLVLWFASLPANSQYVSDRAANQRSWDS